jgi:hypothetical protein
MGRQSKRRVLFGAHALAFVAVVGAGVVAMPLAASATVDATPPALVSVSSVTPGSVDVTAGPGSVAVTIEATDDNSGVDTSTSSFMFSCLCGGSLSSSGSTVQIVGTPQNGAFTYTFAVPSTAQAGTYTLSTLTLADVAGNSVTYPAAPWPAGVTPPSFMVTKAADSTPPSVGIITFSPTVLDVTQANENAAVDVTMSDAVPGVDHGFITVSDGTNSLQLPFDNTNLKSGTRFDGIYEVTFSFDFTETGTWTVAEVDVFDGYGNQNDDTSPGGGALSVTATRKLLVSARARRSAALLA